jgi:hypothetical protein
MRQEHRLGWLDAAADTYQDEAERICAAKHLPNLLAVIARSRAEESPVAC